MAPLVRVLCGQTEYVGSSTAAAGGPFWVGPLPAAPSSRPAWLLILAALLLLSALLLFLMRRNRQKLPRGEVATIAGWLQRGLHVVSVALVVTLFTVLVWPWLEPWMLLAATAFVAVLSVSLWADFVAGFVLRYGRGVQHGVRIEAGKLKGQVDSVGLLSTQLKAGTHGIQSLPNRWLLSQPLRVAADASAQASVEIELENIGVAEARRAITDAVRTSMWVPAGAAVRIKHLGGPRYRVTTDLLSPEFHSSLSAELSERVERTRAITS